MPELPEVEGFRALVERHVVGRTIVRARFRDDWMLKGIAPSTAARRMRNRSVSAVDRRGKLLALFTEPLANQPEAPVLALHFGMTGHPLIEDPGAPLHNWDRLVCDLDSGEQLRYRNSRRLGSIRVVTRNQLADIAWRMGPDPLEVDRTYLGDALEDRQAPIKSLLLDQAFLAGVGNIYADEALHAAGIRPDRPGDTLTLGESDRLMRALQRILRRAVKAHRAGRDASFPVLRVRRQASRQLGASGVVTVGCPRCGRPFSHARIGGRTSYYCRVCQS